MRRGRTKAKPKEAASGSSRPVPGSDTRLVSIEAIDWSLVLRTINVAHVERLAGAIHLPSIKVWEFEPGRYRGIDGYHRWHLAKRRGEKNVSVIVRKFPPGKEGEKAFDFECVQSNIEHGLPLTRQERDRAIVRIWNRWGRRSSSSEGETLDELGALFNLTKQRIHQILVGKLSKTESLGGATPGDSESTTAARAVRPGGFSTFGRFSAATRRVSRLLGDAGFVREILHARHAEVLRELQQLRGLIDAIIQSKV